MEQQCPGLEGGGGIPNSPAAAVSPWTRGTTVEPAPTPAKRGDEELLGGLHGERIVPELASNEERAEQPARARGMLSRLARGHGCKPAAN